MLRLYHAPTSVCSQKVRLGLALIKLDYDSRVLDLQSGDQLAPEYLELNPDAVVPTLVDGDLVVVESSLILAYLDRVYNGSALMPQDTAGRARAEHWLLRCIAIHAAINALSFATAMGPQIRAAKSDAEIDALAAQFPDPIMGAKRRDLILSGLASDYVGQALMHLRRMLADMQAALAKAPGWMSGAAAPGIVDVALAAYVDRIERLGFAGMWADDFPLVGGWLQGWRGTSAYAAAIGAHIPAAFDARMRGSGAAHWAELQQLWQAKGQADR